MLCNPGTVTFLEGAGVIALTLFALTVGGAIATFVLEVLWKRKGS